MQEILSMKNQKVKDWKKLHKKKTREELGEYIIEGFHLVEEAVKAGATVEYILFTERGKAEWQEWLVEQSEALLVFVSDEVMKSLSDLPTPQGIAAIVRLDEVLLDKEVAGGWLLLDNVQDPGNVGTMIRTADAAGLRGVILGEGTADIYNQKVLRAMQGSNYHIPVIRMKIEEAISFLLEKAFSIYGTELNKEAVRYNELPKSQNYALVLGNEGQGVRKEILSLTDKNAYIPIKGQAESLNVAIAAAVFMYYFES
ncbi:MAG: RNA methyltransferase [Lactobacillales bacterium]|jgi:TrmH family RNA methyltransferase|nr:RNA methyltransferase [Lactobacillales bacterium]